MPSKLVDTTTQTAHAAARTLLSREKAGRELRVVSQLRFELMGVYFAKVGAEWGSEGRRESHYMHYIEIPLSGRRQLVGDHGLLSIDPGNVYFYPGNTPVERRCAETCEVLFIKFRCEWLPGVDPLLDWPLRRPQSVGESDPQAWRCWLEPGNICGVQQIFELKAHMQMWMTRVLVDLDSLIDAHLKTHVQFTPAFQLAERELGADLRIEAMAKACGTNRDAFTRAFTRKTGISPKEFLNRRLNQEAIQLVLNTDLKIKQIAEQLRFSDEFYFSRFFQKLNGSAPSFYRQRFRDIGYLEIVKAPGYTGLK